MITTDVFGNVEVDTSIDFEEIIDMDYPFTEVKYPVYILSKGRHDSVMTHKTLIEHGIDNYKIFVEPQDYDAYATIHEEENLVNIEHNDLGISYVRNYIGDYARKHDHEMYWMMDDDFRNFRRQHENRNVVIETNRALAAVESVVDRYANIGIAGIIHIAYAFAKTEHVSVNRLAAGCFLMNARLPFKWRADVVEDIDITLQTLESREWCTLIFNRLMFDTPPTGTKAGGNMLNQFKDDNRYKTYVRTMDAWPDRFKVSEVKGPKQYTLRHTRRFYNDY